MLHEETVEASTLALIRRLMADENLADFYLVGGTALSLKLGHRISIDIDLFIGRDFDSSALNEHLKKAYGLTDEKQVKNGVFGFIDDVKVDFISHQYPLIKPVELTSGIRMLSLEDIGAMKLSAIVQNGSRIKDFIDVYSLLEKLPLGVLVKAYADKYPQASPQIAKTSLLYHKDIDFSVPIKLLDRKFDWDETSMRLSQAVHRPWITFQPEEDQPTQKQRKGPRL
jgi:hypothetical protein